MRQSFEAATASCPLVMSSPTRVAGNQARPRASGTIATQHEWQRSTGCKRSFVDICRSFPSAASPAQPHRIKDLNCDLRVIFQTVKNKRLTVWQAVELFGCRKPNSSSPRSARARRAKPPGARPRPARYFLASSRRISANRILLTQGDPLVRCPIDIPRRIDSEYSTPFKRCTADWADSPPARIGSLPARRCRFRLFRDAISLRALNSLAAWTSRASIP
jgi:hypothetical protein